MQEVATSINQLVSERKRDLLQQRLKITQLGRLDVPLAHQKLTGLTDTAGDMYLQHFVSTQGNIRLYSRLLPKPPTTDSSPDEIRALFNDFLVEKAEGLQLPLSLLNHPDWAQFAPLWPMPEARPWTGTGIWPACPLAEERLTALQTQGIEMAFSNVPMNNDNLARLDPIRPVFISCQLTQAPSIGICFPSASMLPATPCWPKPAR